MAKLNKKRSFRESQKHSQDVIKNMGYRYWERGILNRVISKELFSNPVHDAIYDAIDQIFINLVNNVKQIRTQFSIAHDKDTIFIN